MLSNAACASCASRFPGPVRVNRPLGALRVSFEQFLLRRLRIGGEGVASNETAKGVQISVVSPISCLVNVSRQIRYRQRNTIANLAVRARLSSSSPHSALRS